MAAKTLLLVGATGVVGQSVLRQSLNHPDVGQVITLTRRPLEQSGHTKYRNIVVDFDHLDPKADWWSGVDAVVCTLGTTIRIAKTAEAFRKVDLEMPRTVATMAANAGTKAFVLNSSMMANPNAKGLYLRTKGEAEKAVVAAGFPSVTLARPGLLDGDRQESRFGEEVGLVLSRLFNPMLPKRYRSVKVEKLAAVMLDHAIKATPGVTVLESERFQ